MNFLGGLFEAITQALKVFLWLRTTKGSRERNSVRIAAIDALMGDNFSDLNKHVAKLRKLGPQTGAD